MGRWFLILVAGAVAAPAHDPVTTRLTWSAEISRIVHKRCTGCHHDGGSTPMSLMDFEDASPWAKAIRDEVIARRMPPWGAVKGFGEFRDDISLTEEEITRIAEWVEGGAPEGDRSHLPASLPAAPNASPVPSGVRMRATTLPKPATLLGIHPLADVASAKVTAVEPDGTVRPLIWLLNYRSKWNRTFVYREPIRLPAGTKIVASPPVPIELLTSGVKSRPRTR